MRALAVLKGEFVIGSLVTRGPSANGCKQRRGIFGDFHFFIADFFIDALWQRQKGQRHGRGEWRAGDFVVNQRVSHGGTDHLGHAHGGTLVHGICVLQQDEGLGAGGAVQVITQGKYIAVDQQAVLFVGVVARQRGIRLTIDAAGGLDGSEPRVFQPLERSDHQLLWTLRPAHIIARSDGGHVEGLDLRGGGKGHFLEPPDGELILSG